MIADRRNCWGFSIFCDDIRAELGNKLTLVGLYQAELILTAVEPPPLIIPKLAIVVMYYEMANAIKGGIKFKVSYEGENPANLPTELSEAEINNRPPPAEFEITPSDGGVERITHLRVPVVLSPFAVPGNIGLIKVRAHYEDGSILRLGSLRLKTVSPSAQSTPPNNA